MFKQVVSGIFVFIAFLLLMGSFEIVDATERGLKFRLGSIQEEVLTDGIHFKVPFIEKIKTVNIQPIQLDHVVAVNSDGAITKDNQTIGAEITVFYKYDQEELVRMWRDYGKDNVKNTITQTLRESFKAVVGQYDIFRLPVTQDEIRGKVYEDLMAKLDSYPFTITELKIVNYDWSDQFDAQIAETMQKAQQVKQKEQELLITQQEAQKKVKEAEADKQAAITRAEGEKEQKRLQAEAKALEGEGIKKYNESVAQKWDIEKNKLELEIAKIKAEKWNGVYVPNNMYGPIPVDTVGGVKQ